eukprot:6923059-Karenia_brevis.AAC.1
MHQVTVNKARKQVGTDLNMIEELERSPPVSAGIRGEVLLLAPYVPAPFSRGWAGPGRVPDVPTEA